MGHSFLLRHALKAFPLLPGYGVVVLDDFWQLAGPVAKKRLDVKRVQECRVRVTDVTGEVGIGKQLPDAAELL